MPQAIVLDSCVVIDLIEKPGVVRKIRAGLRGKQIRIVLCDQVLNEVQKVRGLEPKKTFQRISKLLGKTPEFVKIGQEQKTDAGGISDQFHICHSGDNVILSLCQAKSFILLTFDRMLLKTCDLLGVQAFHPSRMGGI